MAWLDDREFWVNLIGFASIASAAIFGLLALFTDYKKDGKVTRWGRLYAGGIALSAVLAMTSAVLQKRIAADEQAAGERAARDQRAQQQAQFDTQLGHLQRLNGHMEQVNEANSTILQRMAASLRTQARLLTSAQQGMLLTSRLGVQERENTGRVLRGLWDETNRISHASFAVQVQLECPAADGSHPPALFPPGSTIELILGPTRFAPSDTRRRVLHDSALARRERGSGGMGGVRILRSFVQQAYIVREEFFGSWRLSQAVRFSSFYSNGPDLRELADPDRWRDIAIEILLNGLQPGIAEEFGRVSPRPLDDRTALLTQGVVLEDDARTDDAFRITRLPCEALAFILVNDRTVATPQGSVYQVRQNADDRRGGLWGRFEIARVPNNTFPRFEGGSDGPATLLRTPPRPRR